jgi:hypothetical protein
MVLYSSIGIVCCAISVVMVNTGLFIRPLGTAFGWNRADVTLSLSIGALVMVVVVCLEKIGPILKRAFRGTGIGGRYGTSTFYA